MSKALQKHLVLHSPEGAEGEGGETTAKAQPRKNDGKEKSGKVLLNRNAMT